MSSTLLDVSAAAAVIDAIFLLEIDDQRPTGLGEGGGGEVLALEVEGIEAGGAIADVEDDVAIAAGGLDPHIVAIDGYGGRAPVAGVAPHAAVGADVGAHGGEGGQGDR